MAGRSRTPQPSAAGGGARRGRRRLLATTAALAVALFGVFFYTVAGGSDTGDGSASGGLPPIEAADPGLAHVHGLGVDPADGTLYAASHFGLFRVPAEGTATRIANRYQDTMGFTVTGPGSFLASGHPDFREDDEPRLGLIESTDAGRTWSSLSLRGQADFHKLQVRHGRVYGYESGTGRLLASVDRSTWETLAELPLLDFAVSPTDQQVLVASSEAGVVRSADGGRTWQPMTGAPSLTVLTWSAAELLGVDTDGRVYALGSDGVWQLRGDVGGAAEAITVDETGESPALFVAVARRGILQSDDGGRTFTTRYATS